MAPTLAQTPAQTPGQTPTDGDAAAQSDAGETVRPREIGGRQGPEPTRYGDWEVGGLASDF
ncbi:hypothetical protein CCR85_01835 [Rhodothalassium salexigens]|uniref:DUF1674 domain-containing protein n=1 Tax=Rhodothalassium salexigens TaxID=1086 RepID=UPI0032119940|nr:hypothetical protein [Rhodothalassium salexigens]